MNERLGLGAVAIWAAPLLAGCVVRWDSSLESDENGDSSLPTLTISEGAPDRLGSEPPRRGVSGAPRPLTPESDERSGERGEESSGLPNGMYRDLIVIDPDVVGGPLASNASDDAPFSFRAQMRWLAGASGDSLELTRRWLLGWETTREVGPELAPVTPRPRVRSVLVDAWRAASSAPSTARALVGDEIGYAGSYTASYTGDESAPASEPEAAEPEGDDGSEGEYGPAQSPAPAEDAAPTDPYGGAIGPAYDGDDEPLPSWDDAPFRLIAIINRVDLAAEACSGYTGELRFVYGAVEPGTSRLLDLTVILEVPYPTTRPAAEWARAWSDLAALPPGQAYAEGVGALTREVQAEGDPLRARLRSNELALANLDDPSWELREFQLQIHDGALGLVQVPLALTPRADADAAALSAFVLENAAEIESSGASLPASLRAGAASIETADFSWSVLGVSERSRRAFSQQTCNGCHGGDTASLPFRHVGPGSSLAEPARLSRFLHDPAADSDELRRRSSVLQALGATECDSSAPAETYPGG